MEHIEQTNNISNTKLEVKWKTFVDSNKSEWGINGKSFFFILFYVFFQFVLFCFMMMKQIIDKVVLIKLTHSYFIGGGCGKEKHMGGSGLQKLGSKLVEQKKKTQ